MRLLLDTNALVRWLNGIEPPPKVGRAIRDPRTHIFVSVVSVWEIVMKSKLGIGAGEIGARLDDLGSSSLNITLEHLGALERLERFPNHRDPFDRLLIAQAVAENLVMISSDRSFGEYKDLRLLWS